MAKKTTNDVKKILEAIHRHNAIAKANNKKTLGDKLPIKGWNIVKDNKKDKE